MRNGTPPIRSLERALALLTHIVTDGGLSDIPSLARAAGIPIASAHRIIGSFKRAGYLCAPVRGRHLAGPVLVSLAQDIDHSAMLAAHARAILEELARSTGQIAHLGVLEADMVTYLVKAGKGGDRLFTREGMQLEAYCSAVGKVLLADQDEEERERYLANGPFIALTPHTIIDPGQLREALSDVARKGFALDEQEVAVGLVCTAVPVRARNGRARAAISLSGTGDLARPANDVERVAILQNAAKRIETQAFC